MKVRPPLAYDYLHFLPVIRTCIATKTIEKEAFWYALSCYLSVRL